MDILAHILSHGVPEAFFPNSLPFRLGNGYTVQEFSSVQVGLTSLGVQVCSVFA